MTLMGQNGIIYEVNSLMPPTNTYIEYKGDPLGEWVICGTLISQPSQMVVFGQYKQQQKALAAYHRILLTYNIPKL